MFVFVIDDNDTQADEEHLTCLEKQNENKSSAAYFFSSVLLIFFLARIYVVILLFFVFVIRLVSNVPCFSGLSIRHCFFGYC